MRHTIAAVATAPGPLGRDNSDSEDEEHRLTIRQRAASEPAPKIAKEALIHNLRVERYRRVLAYAAAPASNKAKLKQARKTAMSKVVDSGSFSEYPTPEVEAVELEAEEEVDEIESRTTPTLWACIALAMISTLLLGYHTSVMSAAEKTTLAGHTTAEWTMAVTAMVIGGFLGASAGGGLSSLLGRERTVLAASAVMLAGSLGLLASPTMVALMGARFTIGLGCGVSMVCVPVYIGELAPPKLRGPLGTGTQLTQCIGILLADVFELIPATADSSTLFMIAAGLSGVQLLVGLVLPLAPSPQFLASKGAAHKDTAVAVCQRLYALDKSEAEEQVAVMSEAAAEDASEGSAEAGASLFADSAYRRLILSVLVLHLAQQLSGINAVFYYATSFFDGIVDNPNVASAMVALVNLIGVCVATSLMDSVPRKKLLAISLSGMILASLVVTGGLLGSLPNIAAVAGIVTFVFFFEIGLGPIPFLIISEMYTTKRVSAAQGMGSQMNWICNICVGVGFLSMKEALGPYVFAPFGCLLTLSLLFFMCLLPETLNRTPEDIHDKILGVGDNYQKF